MSNSERGLSEIDFPALADWMKKQGMGGGEITHATLLAGGTQNVIVRYTHASREYVLRKASRHAHANGNETMRREARVLAALAGTDVPHAALIASCPEEDILGGAFYLMEPVDGFNVSVGMPDLHASSPEIRRQMGFSLIDGLAALSRVDYKSVGLEGFGNPDGFLERQVGRWRKQLDSYAKYENWPGPNSLNHVDDIGVWLNENRPPTFKPGILHGDYHIKNVLYDRNSPRIAAIIDWELTTIGAPMIDLGWLLATWRGKNGEIDGAPFVIEPWQGFPDSSELVDYYAAKTGEDVTFAYWYAVFACYKLALLLEGTYARSCAGKIDTQTGAKFHGNAENLLRKATGWIS